MAEGRTHKIVQNARWSIILQVLAILTKFMTRTVFVRVLGIEYNGLNGLFTEVIGMMSLAELGLGTAIVYNLYKPLAINDIPTVKRLMGLFKTCYNVIGVAMLVIGAVLTPFVHLMVNSVPFDLTYIRVVFMLFVVQTSTSYFVAYKRSLINADQKNHVISKFSIVYNVSLMILNCTMLIIMRNVPRAAFIMYLIMQTVVTLAINIAVSICADKMYPYLKEKAMATKAERQNVFKNVKDLSIGKISGRITAGTDNILVSTLVSTYQTGIYANYALLTNAISMMILSVSNGIVASFGNLVATESGKKVDEVLKTSSFLFFSAATVACCGVACVSTPLVTVWLGEYALIDNSVLYICVLNLFLCISREPLWQMVAVSGLFSKDKYISIAGSTVNLIISIALGKKLGMAGIFLGTSATHTIQIILKTQLLYRAKLNVSAKGFILQWVKNCIMAFVVICTAMWLCSIIHTNPWAAVIIKGLVAVGVSAIGIVAVYGRSYEFKYAIKIVKKILFGKRGG